MAGEPENRKNGNNPELVFGVPAISPALIATLQAMEVLKILLNRGTPFRRMIAYMDLENGDMNRFFFKE